MFYSEEHNDSSDKDDILDIIELNVDNVLNKSFEEVENFVSLSSNKCFELIDFIENSGEKNNLNNYMSMVLASFSASILELKNQNLLMKDDLMKQLSKTKKNDLN